MEEPEAKLPKKEDSVSKQTMIAVLQFLRQNNFKVKFYFRYILIFL